MPQKWYYPKMSATALIDSAKLRKSLEANLVKKQLTAIAAAAALALTMTACGSGSDSGSAEGKTNANAVIVGNDSEPQNPLVPANTNETGGGLILDHIFSGLEYYDAKGNPQMEVAESIKSDDNQNWTIKIKGDTKFSDGTPVTSKSFVDAWNQAVKHNMLNASFFESIQGYDEALKARKTPLQPTPRTVPALWI
ncbi:ABC transporter substrate-binding protein [Mobiluncus curtisii]|nr:ABC transporter substrate-binding protein [Mobiluncus curtisii]